MAGIGSSRTPRPERLGNAAKASSPTLADARLNSSLGQAVPAQCSAGTIERWPTPTRYPAEHYSLGMANGAPMQSPTASENSNTAKTDLPLAAGNVAGDALGAMLAASVEALSLLSRLQRKALVGPSNSSGPQHLKPLCLRPSRQPQV